MKDDGGPAFPVSAAGYYESRGPEAVPVLVPIPGMSLRDWFAGQALNGWMANTETIGSAADAAKYCYELAEGLLAERAKGE